MTSRSYKKSFIEKWVNAFQAILDFRKPLSVQQSPKDLERLDRSAVVCLGKILTSQVVISGNLGFTLFDHADSTYYQFLEFLYNISELPALYPLSIRCHAIRTIGNIVHNVGLVPNNQYQKLIYKLASIFASRCNGHVNCRMHCSILFALSRMAIDPHIQEVLCHTIDSLLPSFEACPILLQIMICKASQHINIPSERHIQFFENYSRSKQTNVALSSYASLTWISMSVKNKTITDYDSLISVISSCLKPNPKKQPIYQQIKASLKMLTLIALNNPTRKEQILKILFSFLKSNIKVCRDRAYYVLARLSIRFHDEDRIKQLVSLGLAHLEYSLQNGNTILFNIVNGLSIIGMHYDKYLVQIQKSINRLLNKALDFPHRIFDVISIDMSSYTESETVNVPNKDIFLGSEEQVYSFTDDLDFCYEWRKNIQKIPDLTSIDVLDGGVGYRTFMQWVSTPTFTIFQDVVAHFVIATEYPGRAELTIPALKERIYDKTKSPDRTTCTWEQISQLLGRYRVLNFVHLLYAFILAPEKMQPEVLYKLLSEMNNSLTGTQTKSSSKKKSNYDPARKIGVPKKSV